jgi:hypothetical protein
MALRTWRDETLRNPYDEPSPEELRNFLTGCSDEIVRRHFAALAEKCRDFVDPNQRDQFAQLLDEASGQIRIHIEATIKMEPKLHDLTAKREELRQSLIREVKVRFQDHYVYVCTDGAMSMKVPGPAGVEPDLLDSEYYSEHREWIEDVHDIRCRIAQFTGNPDPSEDMFRDAEWEEIPGNYQKALDRLLAEAPRPEPHDETGASKPGGP